MVEDFDRITCFISESANAKFPGDDEHPFWLQLESLGNVLRGIGKQYCESGSDPVCGAFRHSDALLWVSSDTPDGAHYFWILLPLEAAFRRAVVDMALSHLTKARRLLPGLYWEVRVAERPAAWDSVASTYAYR